MFAPAKNLHLASRQIPYKPFQPKLDSDAFRESSVPDSLNPTLNDYRNLRHRTHPLRILNYFCINQRLRFSKIAKTIRRASSFQSPRLSRFCRRFTTSLLFHNEGYFKTQPTWRVYLCFFFAFMVPLRVFTLFLHKPGFHLQIPLIISSK